MVGDFKQSPWRNGGDIQRPGRLGGGIMAQRRRRARPARGIKRSAARIPFRLFEAQRRALELVGLPQRRLGPDQVGWRIRAHLPQQTI